MRAKIQLLAYKYCGTMAISHAGHTGNLLNALFISGRFPNCQSRIRYIDLDTQEKIVNR